MSGLLSIDISEARGFVAIPADIDRLAIVIGCSSAGSGLSPFYLSGSAAVSGVGYGDAPDVLTQIIEQRLNGAQGRKFPAALYTTPSGTAGSYGTINLTGVVGTARPANADTEPFGTYHATVRVMDDGNDGAGAAIGTTGITYQTALDYDSGAPLWSTTTALGTAYSIVIANTGVAFTLDPPAAEVTAYVTYINDIRTKALAHFLYTTGAVHGSADNDSDDDVAAAATTIATGIVLSGTLITALVSHFGMGSTVHLTADVGTSLAAATAAQTVAEASGAAQDAITVALLIAAALAAHEASLVYHTIADAVNVVTATAPTRGTLRTGDAWRVRTLAPVPGTSDIAAAFTALAASNAEHTIVALAFPVDSSMVATITTGLNALAAIGRDVLCLARSRLPDFETAETEGAWLADVGTDMFNANDSRISWQTTYGLITDAMTSRQYLRTLLAQIAADTVRVPRPQWPDAPADQQAGAGMPNVTLINADGTTIGHDEGPQGAATGLSNSTLGNRYACVQRLAISTLRQAVYSTVPWVLYAADERVRTVMVRRLVNAMKRVARTTVVPLLGGPQFYQATGPATGLLTPSGRKAIHGILFSAISGEFGAELLNGSDASPDTGVVQIDPAVTVAPGRLLGISVTLAPRPPGYIESITMTISIEE